MEYGYCLNLDFLKGDTTSRIIFDAVVQTGFDYVELPFSQISALNEKELEELKGILKTIPCKASNLFFPPSLTLVGANMDVAGIQQYLQRMLPLASELGIQNLVFGNGGARKIPENESRETVWANLRTIVELMEKYATESKVMVSVEPLNSGETNIINSYGEAVELTKGLEYVATMIDSYHIATDKQNFDDVYNSPSQMKHLHTAYPIGRMIPQPTDNTVEYSQFIQMVKQLNYNDKISVEGAVKSTEQPTIVAEINACLATLKGMFK